MLTETDTERTTSHIRATIDLSKLSTNYGYHSLPLCIIDAVYSIGVRNESVRNVVRRYCSHACITDRWPDVQRPAARESQHTVSEFLAHIEAVGAEPFTRATFRNLQRTSSRSGILKGVAVYRFADILRKNGIEHIQDLPADLDNTVLEKAIRQIPGQSSGISLRYFQMLAGSDDFIKPDRMIFRFLEKAIGHPITVGDATTLLRHASAALRADYPRLTPRLLDNCVWQYQRNR